MSENPDPPPVGADSEGEPGPPPPDSLPRVPVPGTMEAHQTIFKGGQMVGYIWYGKGGGLRRAGKNAEVVLVASEVADVLCFDPSLLPVLEKAIKRAEDKATLVLNLELEELRVDEGPSLPNPSSRQF